MISTTCNGNGSTRGTVSQFIEERRFLKNVTPKTLLWYQDAFKAFQGALDSEADIKHRIVELRSRGVSAISVNSWLRCINAYLKWQGAGFKLPKLKEEQKIIATLTPEQMARLIAFKPKGINQTRTHTAALLILDGGYRISELLELASDNVDFQNLVVKVRGKVGIPVKLNSIPEGSRTPFRTEAEHHRSEATLAF